MNTEKPNSKNITRSEAKLLFKKVQRIGDAIPSGLSNLNEALTFALLDLAAFTGQGFKMKSFDKAITFLLSIPDFEDLKSEACADWMLHDREHLKYLDL